MSSLRPLLLLAGLTFACAPPAPPPPNVLLVVLDTVRTDHLSAYGYELPTTPHLDALAARGALFEDCTAQASWTMPSMISLMTGLPIFTNIYRIPDTHAVVAESFADAGYRTGAFVANSLLAEDAGFRRGFQSWDARAEMTKHWTADDVTGRALAFLDEDDERPFFLWLHYLDPHWPYDPPDEPWHRTAEEVFTPWEREGIRRAIDAAPADERPYLEFQADVLARQVDRYDGELRYLDDSIGRLLDVLARRGLADDTYVVVAGDHGETLFRRPENPDRIDSMRRYRAKREVRMRLEDYLKREHDGWVYEELVRTPLVFTGPGIVTGQRVDALVSNLDVVPTLLELCGLPRQDTPGRSHAAALRGDGPWRSAVWATTMSSGFLAAKLPDGRKVVLPRENMSRRHGFAPQLFDLRADPDERFPLALDDEAQALRARLEQASEDDPFSAWSAEDIDPETEARLRELGYIR